jgi:hypothetical protein
MSFIYEQGGKLFFGLISQQKIYRLFNYDFINNHNNNFSILYNK